MPTHVQAEDRVLLWFTFPQVVALTAVCALSYGAYRVVPVGPSEVRMALAVLLGLAGIVAVVGQIGGRRLPLVAADLLKYRLGARRYAGLATQLVRSEAPAPVQSGPGLLSLMAKRAGREAHRIRTMAKRGLRRRRRSRERRNGRKPFLPHDWFGKRRRDAEKDNISSNGDWSRKDRRRNTPKTWLAAMAAAVLAVAVVAVPQAALADGPGDEEDWSSPEVEFRPPQPVEGRRLFVEELTVSRDRAKVTLRAATGLDIRVRAYGGSEGRSMRFYGAASLAEGERTDYSLPLSGDAPSLTFSWEDSLGQAGAFTLKDDQLPYPLPTVDGEFCDLRVVSLGWTPGIVNGVIESDCVSTFEEAMSLQTVMGHESVAETALLDAEVRAIAGSVNVAIGGSKTNVSFVPNGQTRFRLPVGTGKAVHAVTIEVGLRAALRIPLPPLTRLTHHPARTEYRTRTVSMWRPGTSRTVSETVTVTHDDGTTTTHTIEAYLSVPSRTVYRNVTLAIVHPERVLAEVVERAPLTRSRSESLSLMLSVGSDDPFETLSLPEPEPEPERGKQTPADGDLSDWFDILGWEWPW